MEIRDALDKRKDIDLTVYCYVCNEMKDDEKISVIKTINNSELYGENLVIVEMKSDPSSFNVIYKNLNCSESIAHFFDSLESPLNKPCHTLNDFFKILEELDSNNIDSIVFATNLKDFDSLNKDGLEHESTESMLFIEKFESILSITSTYFCKFLKTSDIPEYESWLLLHDSVIGLAHDQVCQDNHVVEEIKNGWGVAVVCDGAGSARFSDLGSNFVANEIKNHLVALINKYEWSEREDIPNIALWHEFIKRIFRATYTSLKQFSKEKEIEVKDLYCTAIATVYSPFGLLVAHIGDGRACYRDEQGEWHSIIKPFKGDFDDGTLFLPADFIWSSNMSDAFIESRVINEKITAFALLSDGCEDYTYETKKEFSETAKFLDVNKPFVGFWENVYDYYHNALVNKKKPANTLNVEWSEMLTTGDGFVEEQDDKTMVFGILLSDNQSIIIDQSEV